MLLPLNAFTHPLHVNENNRHSTLHCKLYLYLCRGGQLWEALALLVYVRFEKFKNWLKAYEKHYIFATGNIRESADFRENREIFLHAKISCFTVIFFFIIILLFLVYHTKLNDNVDKRHPWTND